MVLTLSLPKVVACWRRVISLIRGCCQFPGESATGAGVALAGVARAPPRRVLLSARAVVEDIAGGRSPCAAGVVRARGWECGRRCATRDVGSAQAGESTRWDSGVELLWLVRLGESGDAEASPRGVVVVVVVGTGRVMSRKPRQEELQSRPGQSWWMKTKRGFPGDDIPVASLSDLGISR